MENLDNLEIYNIRSDEFKFLDYPNTFLSDDLDGDENELNKSANTQLEEKLKELIKKTQVKKENGIKQNGNLMKQRNYLDDLNDLKELKKIEDKKSYEQSLDRLSKLNLGGLNGGLSSGLTSVAGGLNGTNVGSTIVSNFASNSTNYLDRQDRRLTISKFSLDHLKSSKSNNHLSSNVERVKSEAPKFDSSFDLRTYDVAEEQDQTFTINNKLLNMSLNDENQLEETFTVAKNYDEIQEIARKQEEALKQRNRDSFLPFNQLNQPNQPNNLSNNATIVKTRKQGPSKLDTTITLKHFINESLNENVKSPNLDGTFNLGNPLGNLNSPQPNNHTLLLNNSTIKKEKISNQRTQFNNQKTNIKRILNRNLETKSNPLNSSFIVQSANEPADQNAKTDNHQFSTITKNKINKNLKRTNTFKVRESAYASEENLTYSSMARNGNPLNQSFIKSCLSNNYQSVDDMKNYETIKLNKAKVNSKSNGNLNGTFSCRDVPSKNLFNTESTENLNNGLVFRANSKLPAFTSRLKAPSRVSVIKSEEI